MFKPVEEINQDTEAFLDIETTGLYPTYHEITVVGIYVTDGVRKRLFQLVGDKINRETILSSLQGVSTLYTYNGSRFDLPFIHARYGVNLASCYKHLDLMYSCWKNNLFGGLKNVEICLGIERSLKGVNGYEAVRLWWKYVNDYNEASLQTLLDYNKEDVINLKVLKDRLLRSST